MSIITALPTAPARTMNSATFISTADAFLAALGPMVTQINSVINAFNAAQSGTSVTSLTIGTGDQTLITQTGLGFLVGQYAYIASTASPSNKMNGVVKSYNSVNGQLVITVTSVVGSGNFSSWQIGLGAVSLPSALDIANILGYVPLSTSYRNRVINGDFRISQRNAGNAKAVTASTSVYIEDKIKMVLGTGVAANGQQVAINWAGVAAPYAMQATVTTLKSVLSVGDVNEFQHIIEGSKISDMHWGTSNAQTANFSCQIQVSVAGDYSFAFSNAAGNRCFVHKVTLAANTPTLVSFNVAGDIAGTWPTTNAASLILRFIMGAGSTLQTTGLDAWGGGAVCACSTQTNLFATNGATYAISEIQFEPGTSRTNFERREYADELQLCQRYYEHNFPVGTVPGDNNNGQSYVIQAWSTSTTTSGIIQFSATKRAAATMTFYSGSRAGSPTAGHWNYLGTAWTDGGSTTLNSGYANGFIINIAGTFTTLGCYLACGGWVADADF